jgi:hypothetical protein
MVYYDLDLIEKFFVDAFRKFKIYAKLFETYSIFLILQRFISQSILLPRRRMLQVDIVHRCTELRNRDIHKMHDFIVFKTNP